MHHQTSLTESQKGVVRRYVEAWRRWRPGIRGFAEVEMDMENGSKVLADGITVDDRSELPVIVADARDHRFYAAIFDYDDDAIDDITRMTPREAPTILSFIGQSWSMLRSRRGRVRGSSHALDRGSSRHV